MSSNHWNHDVAFSLALSTAVDTEFGKSCIVEAAWFTWSIAVCTGFSSANTDWIDKTSTKESNKATTAIFAISNSFHGTRNKITCPCFRLALCAERKNKGVRLEYQDRKIERQRENRKQIWCFYKNCNSRKLKTLIYNWKVLFNYIMIDESRMCI